MQSLNKPFSPFGEVFHYLQLSKIKLRNSVYIFCGKEAYKEAKQFIESGEYSLCIPYGKKVSDYKWSIRNLRIILYDTGGMSSLGLLKLAHEFSQEGIHQICIFTEQKTTAEVFTIKKELHNVKGRNI